MPDTIAKYFYFALVIATSIVMYVRWIEIDKTKTKGDKREAQKPVSTSEIKNTLRELGKIARESNSVTDREKLLDTLDDIRGISERVLKSEA